MRSRSQEHPVCIDISALKSLEVQPSSWDDPTTKPLDGVVKSFIERCGRYVGASRQSSEILRIIALRWGASELWNRATMLIGTRETLEAITIGGAMSALRAFGLNAIQPGWGFSPHEKGCILITFKVCNTHYALIQETASSLEFWTRFRCLLGRKISYFRGGAWSN